MLDSPATPDSDGAASLRFVIVTLDRHLASTIDRIRPLLRREMPGLELSLHAATEWAASPDLLDQCKRDIARADIVLANMLFMDDHLRAIEPALAARGPDCDAMVGILAAGEVIKLTRLGRLRMDAPQRGPLALLKRLRGSKAKTASSGAGQMAMLKRLPKILKFIPGKAQDLRAYFLTMQYWLSGSDANIANLVRFLISRYAAGPRAAYRDLAVAGPPMDYPEVGVYHPRLRVRPGGAAAARLSGRLEDLPRTPGATGAVGLLLMRSYLLADDAAHYDAVIAALEARGLRVIPAYASGLDGRPAVERFFMTGPKDDRKSAVDLVISLTGFSLVGGPAYNDAAAAEAMLAKLDTPYMAAHALEFQSVEDWSAGERGLTPIEATMMVAIPEIDGAVNPMVFAGRAEHAGGGPRAMAPCPDRIERLAGRAAAMIRLRRTPPAERKLAITLFNFPPNAGATGTAAFLDVFASLHHVLARLKAAGYRVAAPDSVEALRDAVLVGAGDAAAARWGADAAVAARIPVDDHVRAEPHLAEIEAQWGPAPGRHQTDGRSIFVLGAEFGDVFVGVQPAFGYEGDPMRLLFERGFAPTHAFSAYYRWLREDFGADAVLHFGTHGALEFMPGKQTGLSAACWPDRLIGDTPNVYLYAANNPSEGAIAKRRSAATLVSHQTPPLAEAGLYRGLADLKGAIDRWRAAPPEAAAERAQLVAMIAAQAASLDLAAEDEDWSNAEARIQRLAGAILEVEYALIPHGLHVVGRPPAPGALADTLGVMAEAMTGSDGDAAPAPSRGALAAIAGAPTLDAAMAAGRAEAPTMPSEMLTRLSKAAIALKSEAELDGLMAALDCRFVAPAPGGDLARTPEALPTGRNLHGFDPFRLPSAYAVEDGRRQAGLLLARRLEDAGALPETVAMVLWGTDTLKTEGAPIGQALALMGAAPRLDSYGRVCGARLLPLADLGRPRIDVIATLSGIFRDLLPLQTKLLAEAAYLAATADEPLDQNFIRKHALAYADRCGCDLETASLRVFSNADGAYGSNVNQLIDSGAWGEEDELADAYAQRKCFAYGRSGKPERQLELLSAALGDVDLAYQNLDSVELGVTTIDHYFDTLGGVSRAVRKAKRDATGEDAAADVYIGDQTRGTAKVRSLAEQVSLETRTRTLNPKWYEGMLQHGYEGVRQIEAHVTNTMGWSATTGQVAPWIYQQITETFVLDDEMRQRLAALNPKASARVAERLLEAHERQYWRPDAETLEALRRAGDELEDHLEGVAAAPSSATIAAE